MDNGYVDDADLYKYSDGNYFSSFGGGKGKEEAYDDDDERPAAKAAFRKPPKAPSAAPKKKNDFIMEEVEEEEDERPRNGIVLKKFKSHDVDPAEILKNRKAKPGDPPIHVRPRTQNIVSFRIHRSAGILLDAHQQREIQLDHGTISALNEILKCDDEYTKTDPYVVICDTLSNGACSIYLKEVVPVSLLLLARFLGCVYVVDLGHKMRSKPKLYSDVFVKPFHDSKTEHAQPFGLLETVQEELEARGNIAEEAMQAVQVHMLRLGVIASVDACDDMFLEEQTVIVGKLLK
jgi:hypothetical protein